MQLTVASWDDRVFSIEVDGAEQLDTLRAILEAESGLPAAQQQLLHNGRPLPDGQALQQAGVASGDMLLLLPAGAGPAGGSAGARQAPQPQQQQRRPSNPLMELNADGSAKAPAAFIQQVRANPEMMAAVRQGNPRLAAAIQNEDVGAVQDVLREVRAAQLEREKHLALEDELLSADPFDADAQRRIEELIQQKNIEENLAAALEHSPEVFGSVTMLYVDMEVNGVPVKTFVDSGAQMTIMTQDFASKCYLTRLIDKRFQGMAVGVGSSRIIGRIHTAPMKVSGHFITTSITVLEQRDGPQFIFGLDMLKRHQCILDLAAGRLTFGSVGASLSFLPEHDIPKDFSRHIEQVSKEDAEKNMAEAKRDDAPSSAAGPSTTGSEAAAAGPTPMDATPSAAPPPPTAPRPLPQPPPPAAPAAPAGDAAKVERLMALGFPRDVCVQALQAGGGNEDAAASILFSGME